MQSTMPYLRGNNSALLNETLSTRGVKQRPQEHNCLFTASLNSDHSASFSFK